MTLHVYNTLTQKKDIFTPLTPGQVKLYLCGPTVYDYLHIGNFRGPIVFNLIVNWLEHIGYKVNYVYNYTDVDDKIIKRANDEKVDSLVISERYIKAFQEDYNNLGLRQHNHNPKVTEFIPEIVSFVEELVAKNKAYVVDGEVFYAIDTFKDYGKLSKKKLDELEVGQRVDVDPRKKNPMDFVLWKPSKAGEPKWPSPWGEGRPGWHIECSAMIRTILGDQIDIHGGGIDLIFPHHENEIAQSEGLCGTGFCRHWIHNNFINLNNEKMSKSLGNVMKGRDFMHEYHPEILKYLFLSVHYRSMFDVNLDKIGQTISSLSRIYNAIFVAQTTSAQKLEGGVVNTDFKKKLDAFTQQIEKSMNDDFNSAELISSVFEGVRAFNALGLSSPKKKTANDVANAHYFLNWIHFYGKLCALFNEDAIKMLDRLDDILLMMNKIDRAAVDALIESRSFARAQKDWAKADEIRLELDKLGIELTDGMGRGYRVKVS